MTKNDVMGRTRSALVKGILKLSLVTFLVFLAGVSTSCEKFNWDWLPIEDPGGGDDRPGGGDDGNGGGDDRPGGGDDGTGGGEDSTGGGRDTTNVIGPR